MRQKLDPRLLEILERSAANLNHRGEVDVLVAVDAPLSASVRDDLVRRGLALRTEAGTVLTGSVQLTDVILLADSPRVVQIELSAPLYPERASGGEGPIE